MVNRPTVIGIAGPSCSGKSTLARGLAERLEGGARVIEIDWYYHDQTGRSTDEIDVDIPDAIEHPLLVTHLQRLVAGEAIERPDYDYATHSRSANGVRIEPAPNLIVEGLFTLYWPRLRALLDRAVFIEADANACLARRIERDTRERGRSADEVERQFHAKVLPMYERHVHPTREHAGLVLDGGALAGSLLSDVLNFIA